MGFFKRGAGIVYLRLKSSFGSPLPDEFYFNPVRDIKNMRKPKSSNLQNFIHASSKCPTYVIRIVQWKKNTLLKPASYVLGVEKIYRDVLEFCWNTAATEALARKFIADTATHSDFK